MATLLLVDGHAYAYRAFYAIRKLNAPDGKATNAIYGFVKMLGRLRTLVAPSHLAVIWDGGLSAERMAALPGYKAQRPPMPDDLDTQIGNIQEYLEAAGIPSLQHSGVEADDIIATLARQAAAEAAKVVIASSDKDFFQLISPAIGLLNPAEKSERVWNESDVWTKTGVQPDQIVDWLSLIGDAVDNIPGVAGVGPKTAAGLLEEFGHLDAIYTRLAEISSERLRSSLQEAEAAVRRNQTLIRLNDAVPGLKRWGDLINGGADLERLFDQFQRWGFKGLAADVAALRARQGELFGALNRA
jgi:DNA polymerase-1